MAKKVNESKGRSRILLIATIVIITPILWGIVRNIYHALKRHAQNHELRVQIEDYQENIYEDSLIIERLKYDDGLEEYAREHYYMQRKGEKIYIIE